MIKSSVGMQLKVRTGVVLVGGAGLRMRPLTEDVPKPMIKLRGKPILHWTLDWLKKYAFKHIVLGVAYRRDMVIDYIRKNQFGLDIDFSTHTVEGGTGEGFRLAIERYVDDENFLAMNGDELTNLNLNNMINFHLKSQPVGTVAVSPMRSPFGIVQISKNNIIGFEEKPILEDRLVSIGIYIFNHRIIDYLPAKGALEKTTFPSLALLEQLKAYKLSRDERWMTINTVKDLSAAEEEFELIRRL